MPDNISYKKELLVACDLMAAATLRHKFNISGYPINYNLPYQSVIKSTNLCNFSHKRVVLAIFNRVFSLPTQKACNIVVSYFEKKLICKIRYLAHQSGIELMRREIAVEYKISDNSIPNGTIVIPKNARNAIIERFC